MKTTSAAPLKWSLTSSGFLVRGSMSPAKSTGANSTEASQVNSSAYTNSIAGSGNLFPGHSTDAA